MPEEFALQSPIQGPRLTDVRFGRGWRSTAAGARVVREMSGFRAIGVARCETEAGEIEGVLLRHRQRKAYRLVAGDAVIELSTEDTERFLKRVRGGHHGGPGRTQGPFARDSTAYTSCRTVTITESAIDAGIKYGDGILSLGIRALARAAALRERRTEGGFPGCDELQARIGPMEEGITKVRVYLDHETGDYLRQLGGGNLSRGIRFAAWLASHHLRKGASDERVTV